MSKKKLLLKKLFYLKDQPEKFFREQSFKIDSPKREFLDVLKYLEERKYIYLTDDGYYHLLPKGVFVHKAIVSKVEELMKSEGFVQYRFSGIFSSTASNKVDVLIKKFESQVYKTSAENKKTRYLKYASDPLIFNYFSNRELRVPSKIYSPDYFYRIIQKGELKPLIQPREFYMTDFHYFSELNDFDSFIKMAELNKRAVESFVGENDWYLNIDTNLVFFNSHKGDILKMLKKLSTNAVLNITSEKTHYYSIQNQYIVNYYFSNRAQLANLQFDQKNGKVFNIKSSKTKGVVSIIHGTAYGRVEKILALVFGKQIENSLSRGIKPVLPLWLSPIMVRVIPINNNSKINKYISLLSNDLRNVGCRFDIDSRDIPFQKKIKSAEHDWIPFQFLIGDKEIDSKNISLRDRYENTSYSLTINEFVLKIKKLSAEVNPQKQETPSIFTGDDFY